MPGHSPWLGPWRGTPRWQDIQSTSPGLNAWSDGSEEEAIRRGNRDVFKIVTAFAAIAAQDPSGDVLAVTLSQPQEGKVDFRPVLYIATAGVVPDSAVRHLHAIWARLCAIKSTLPAGVAAFPSDSDLDAAAQLRELETAIYVHSLPVFQRHVCARYADFKACVRKMKVQRTPSKVYVPKYKFSDARIQRCVALRDALKAWKKILMYEGDNERGTALYKATVLPPLVAVEYARWEANLRTAVETRNPINYIEYLTGFPMLQHLRDVFSLHTHFLALRKGCANPRFSRFLDGPLTIHCIPPMMRRFEMELDYHKRATAKRKLVPEGSPGDLPEGSQDPKERRRVNRLLSEYRTSPITGPSVSATGKSGRPSASLQLRALLPFRPAPGSTSVVPQAYVHGECTLLAHIHHTLDAGADVFALIGTSAPSCLGCTEYFCAYRTAIVPHVFVRSACGAPHFPWVPPLLDVADGPRPDDTIRVEMMRLACGRLTTYLQRSFGLQVYTRPNW